VSLSDYTRFSFSYGETTRDIYQRGTGPGVVIMHEIPGMTPPVIAFADRVVDAGFTVYLPHLFGTPGQAFSIPYALGQMARACVSREFSVLASRQSSPITDFLRALCRKVHEDLGGKGVGALGMCLTGNFALALMVDDVVMAPVLSQPSLPLPVGTERRSGIHVSDEELAIIKRRTEAGVTVLGLRFTRDPACPGERFERLRQELGDGFESIEIDSSPGNPYGIPAKAHSVLTLDLVDQEGHPTRKALDRVLEFFRERLT